MPKRHFPCTWSVGSRTSAGMGLARCILSVRRIHVSFFLVFGDVASTWSTSDKYRDNLRVS